MSTIIQDGFDFYAQGSSIDFGNYWDTVAANPRAVTSQTRFGVGQSCNLNGSGGTFPDGNFYLLKAAPGNNADNFAGFARYYGNAQSGTQTQDGIAFIDGTTAQCTVCFRSDGAIIVLRGDANGTLIATFTGAWASATWDQWQIEVKIDNAAGEVHIRKNGASTDTFSATGLDTQVTANAYANVIGITNGTSNGGGSIFYDDFWAWQNDGTFPTTWLGDFRAVQVMPNADTAQKDFTPNLLSSQLGNSTQSGSNTISLTANNVILTPVQTVVGGGELTSLNINFNAGFSGNVKLAIYDSDGTAGAPQTLLAITSAVTNPVSGVNNFPLATPLSITLQNGHQYYIAYLADTTGTAKAGTSVSRSFVANTYASGFPSTLSGLSSGSANQFLGYGAITTDNAGMLNEKMEDGAATFVEDATAGDFDLYATGGLPFTPDSILSVNVRGFASKSDAGTREAAITTKSGATSTDSANFTLSTSFQNIFFTMDNDPNTGLPWTVTGVNNLQFGPKVTV